MASSVASASGSACAPGGLPCASQYSRRSQRSTPAPRNGQCSQWSPMGKVAKASPSGVLHNSATARACSINHSACDGFRLPPSSPFLPSVSRASFCTSCNVASLATFGGRLNKGVTSPLLEFALGNPVNCAGHRLRVEFEVRLGPGDNEFIGENGVHAAGEKSARHPGHAAPRPPFPPVLHNDFLGLVLGDAASQKFHEPPNVNLGDVFRDDVMLVMW